MLYISFECGKVSLKGSLDYLIEFMKVNNLLLGSYNEYEGMDITGTLGAYFNINYIEIISYEQYLINKENTIYSDYYNYASRYDQYTTFRPFIYKDKKYTHQLNSESSIAMNEFPGLLKYMLYFYHDEEHIRLVKSKHKPKYPQISNEEDNISIKEIDEKIGWNLFCNTLNINLDFNSLKTKSSLEILFDSDDKDLVAVRVNSVASTIDPFVKINIKLVESNIVELGSKCECNFHYSPELFNFRGEHYIIIDYYPHCYTVIDSAAKNVNEYLITCMSHIFN